MCTMDQFHPRFGNVPRIIYGPFLSPLGPGGSRTRRHNHPEWVAGTSGRATWG